MANQKSHYYILVFTDTGAVYLTGIGENKIAYWEKTEKPYELSKSRAEDICFGLNCNLHLAAVVCSPHEIQYQPYRYSDGYFEWKWNEESEV